MKKTKKIEKVTRETYSDQQLFEDYRTLALKYDAMPLQFLVGIVDFASQVFYSLYEQASENDKELLLEVWDRAAQMFQVKETFARYKEVQELTESEVEELLAEADQTEEA